MDVYYYYFIYFYYFVYIDCNLGNDGLKVICDLIKTIFSSMKELTLDGNNITREGCALLWDAFSNSRHQFEWISLNNNRLGLRGIDKLKYGLITCFHLGQLYLNSIYILFILCCKYRYWI